MKLVNNITLFLLLSIVVSCDKCKDTVEPEPEICEINGEVIDDYKGVQIAKDYMYFKTGTYWIYEEETTGYLDTITVYEHGDGLDDSQFYDYYWFSCKAYSSYTTYDYYNGFHESFSGGCATNTCQCHKVKRTKVKPGDFVGAHRDFFFPAKLGDYQQIGGSDFINYKSEITAIESDFSIQNIIFNNVITYDVGWCYSEDNQRAIFSIAENIGIVKKELIDDEEVWNLIEYQIEQ